MDGCGRTEEIEEGKREGLTWPDMADERESEGEEGEVEGSFPSLVFCFLLSNFLRIFRATTKNFLVSTVNISL